MVCILIAQQVTWQSGGALLPKRISGCITPLPVHQQIMSGSGMLKILEHLAIFSTTMLFA